MEQEELLRLERLADALWRQAVLDVVRESFRGGALVLERLGESKK